MPTCTVVVPCFNRAGLLGDCLKSLLAQTFSDWEAVVVDDASTEGGIEEVVQGFRDARLTYVRHEANRGPGASRNTAIKHSTSPLIFTLDSDDLLEERCLERLVPMLDADPTADCAYPDLAMFGSRSGVLRFGVGDERRMVQEQWVPGPGCLFRRSLWERLGGYSEAEALSVGNEDWDFYLTATEFGFKASHLAEPLYRYRIGLASTSTRLRYHDYQTREFIYARHRSLFDRYRAGRSFRASGYRSSAMATLAAGERWLAVRLAIHGWLLQPANQASVFTVLTCLAPRVVVSAVRSLRQSRRGAPP